MPLTSKEKQKRFKAKMYKAGLKQINLWVRRKESRKAVKMTQSGFIKNFKKLTHGWDEDSLTQLYSLLIKITKGKKEAARLKERT